MVKLRSTSDKLSKPGLNKTMKRKSLKNDKPIISKFLRGPRSKLNKELYPLILDNLSVDDESDSDSVVNTGHLVRPPFSIDRDQIEKGVKAVFEYILQSRKDKTELFDEEEPIFLQVTAVKVPKTATRQIRLLLKHSLLSEESEICLIVKDIGKAKDYDETIEHYQKLLTKHGVKKIKTIMPFHQFKNEYGNQFELKRKLVGLYDYFLVDGRISGYVAHLLGKIFYEKRKMPTSIKMDATNLQNHIESALCKTIMKIHSKGDSYSVQVGHSQMTNNQVFENIINIIDELFAHFPGSFDNIRQLGLKTEKGFTIPIYLTMKNNNAVKVPVIKPKLPKAFEAVTGELTTYNNRDVTVLPSGKVVVIDKKEKNQANKSFEEYVDTDISDEEHFDSLEVNSDNRNSDDDFESINKTEKSTDAALETSKPKQKTRAILKNKLTKNIAQATDEIENNIKTKKSTKKIMEVDNLDNDEAPKKTRNAKTKLEHVHNTDKTEVEQKRKSGRKQKKSVAQVTNDIESNRKTKKPTKKIMEVDNPDNDEAPFKKPKNVKPKLEQANNIHKTEEVKTKTAKATKTRSPKKGKSAFVVSDLELSLGNAKLKKRPQRKLNRQL